MSEPNEPRNVPEGWPEAARYDDTVWDSLRRLANIKGLLTKIEHVLRDPGVCRAAAAGPITSRNLRAVEVQLAQAWNYELAQFAQKVEVKRAERAEREREEGGSGLEVAVKVPEVEGERARFVCGRIDLDRD